VNSPISGPAREVGPYTLLDALGEGGMARVYLAQRQGSPELCVLKVLHAALQTHTEAARRFQREAHIASQLDHAHIAPILDAGFDQERFYLTMPLIEGEHVEQLVQQAARQGRRLPVPVALGIAMQVLDALSYAHELRDPEGKALGLVHRDLSPRNVMVDYDGRAHIIDFGVAKGQVDDFKTASGVLMGTPYYMSPEQAQALRVDHRSDLYTFATVLYEMLTGQRTATGKSRSAVLLAVVRGVPPAASILNEQVPLALDAVLARALEKEAEDRFSSAREFSQAILQVVGEDGIAKSDQIGLQVRSLCPEGLAEAQTRREQPPVYPSPLPEPGSQQEPTRTAAASTRAHTPATQVHLPPTQAVLRPTRVIPPTTTLAAAQRRSRLWSAGAVLTLLVLGAVLMVLAQSPTAPQPAPQAPPRAAPPRPSAAPQPAVQVAPAPAPAAQPAAQAPTPKVPTRPAPAAPKTEPKPVAPSVAAADAPVVHPLRQRWRALRKSRDKGAALELAKDLSAQAQSLEAAEASRLRAEVDRVFLTGNIDTMLDALNAALRIIGK